MRAAIVVCLVAGCGRFGFDEPRRIDASDDGEAQAPDGSADAPADGATAIVGFATYVGTWSDTSAVHHANVDVAWEIPAASWMIGNCSVAPGGSCGISGARFQVTTAMTEEVYGMTARYMFADPSTVRTVRYTLDATAGTVPTIYPPGVGDRMQFLHGDDSVTNIPGLTCTPPDIYYYTTASVTITCSW